MNKETKKSYKPSSNGRFGKFGGKFVPETLMSSLKEIENAFDEISKDQSFWDELILLQKDFVGRPTPIYFAKNLSQKLNQNIWIKREDLAHTGAHKINNALGQGLLAKKLGKKRIIAFKNSFHGRTSAAVAVTDNKYINSELNKQHNVSFIALSFVRSAKDIVTLRSILKRKKSQIKIIAKIENQEGLDNIHEITQAADIVMVARGDLGIETDLADLPNIQRRIMYASAKWGRRSIVATHLLESMINNPTPTRAEVTDVANAIYEGSDAVMLSGETSIGKYPIQCIKMIKKIASKTEHFRTLGYEKFLQDNSDWQNIAKGARDLASRVNADAIVIITRSGQTANVVSNTKPFRMPIFAFTNNKDTFHQLSLVGGMQPRFIKSITNQSRTISRIKSILNSEKKTKKSLKFVLIAGIYSASHTDSIQIIST